MKEEEKYKKAINELADSYELHLKQWAKRCIDTINEYTTNLQQELQQKENIIKEVREYITKQVHRNQQFYEMDIENILEILDKDITEKSDCNYEKVEEENK